MIIFHHENDCHIMFMANNVMNPYSNNTQYDDKKFLCVSFFHSKHEIGIFVLTKRELLITHKSCKTVVMYQKATQMRVFPRVSLKKHDLHKGPGRASSLSSPYRNPMLGRFAKSTVIHDMKSILNTHQKDLRKQVFHWHFPSQKIILKS